MLVLLFGAVTLFHARGLRPGYAFLPIDNVNNNLPWRAGPFVLGELQNPLVGDPIYQYYPVLVDQLQAVRAGHWPLWSTQILLGHPLLGDPMAQTFYPAFLALGLVLGPARGLTVGYWLHVVLAVGLTYAWLRSAGLGRAGSSVGALAYALGGFMVTFFATPFWMSTLAWLPGVLWLYERAVQRRSLSHAASAGLALGLAGLAGQLSFTAMFYLFLVYYAFGHVWQARRRLGRFDFWPLVSLSLTLGIGVLLASAQILPAMETLAQSHRSSGVGAGLVPWRQVITSLVPNFYGNPTTTRAYWGAGNFAEATCYTGIVTLFLALLAPVTTRRFWPIYMAGLGVAIVYTALGGPGISVLTQLPLIQFVNLGRTLFLLPLVVGYLAGTTLKLVRPSVKVILGGAAGFAALMAWAYFGNWNGGTQTHIAELQGPIAWASSLLVAAVLLLLVRRAWSPAQGWSTWLLAGLVYVDLLVFGSRFNPALPVSTLPRASPAITFLQENAPPYRVATRQLPGDIIFGPNYLTVFGLNDLDGYSSLLPRGVVDLVAAGDPLSGGYNGNTIWLGAPSQRLLDVLQAGFVVSHGAGMDTGPRAEVLGTCVSQTHELTANQPITGTVAVRSIALNRLDLTLRTRPGSTPAGTLVVHMWQGSNRDRLVLEGQADLSRAVDHQTLTFYFAPEKDAPGHVYAWEVTTASRQTAVAVCAATDGQPSAGLFGEDWQVAYDGELTISERLGRLPRAFVVYSAETIADEKSAIHRVLDESFDIRNVAVLSQPATIPSSSDLSASPADILSYSDTEVVLRATAVRAGLLVLGDQAYPGWQAWVDGQPADVLTANVVWRGVLLQPGEHQVEFKFAPRSLQIGLALAAAGIVLAASLWAFGRWKSNASPATH